MINYELIRSNRKTVVIHIKYDKVVVKAPLKFPQEKIEAFVISKASWINKKLIEQGERIALPDIEIDNLKIRAKSYLPQRTYFIAEKLNLTPNSVKITSAKTRWGSCSGSDNICYTYKLMLLPAQLIDYIIIHELCHIKEKNHSKHFYNLLAAILPNYKDLQKQLKCFKINSDC